MKIRYCTKNCTLQYSTRPGDDRSTGAVQSQSSARYSVECFPKPHGLTIISYAKSELTAEESSSVTATANIQGVASSSYWYGAAPKTRSLSTFHVSIEILQGTPPTSGHGEVQTAPAYLHFHPKEGLLRRSAKHITNPPPSAYILQQLRYSMLHRLFASRTVECLERLAPYPLPPTSETSRSNRQVTTSISPYLPAPAVLGDANTLRADVHGTLTVDGAVWSGTIVMMGILCPVADFKAR